MPLASFREAVSDAMRRTYGITWQDASGDEKPLARAIAAGRTAVDFVDWWGESRSSGVTSNKWTGRGYPVGGVSERSCRGGNAAFLRRDYDGLHVPDGVPYLAR